MPAHLATFTPDDWPGETIDDQIQLWRAARDAYADEHGWPGGALARIAGYSDVIQRREGRPLLPWCRSEEELARLERRPPRRRRDL